MAFIDELAKRFGDVVKKVGEKSEQLVELGKLNYELFKEEDTIRRLYREIGQAVYEAYKQENNSLNEIYRLCQEIDEHREKVESLKKQVEDLKKEAQATNDDSKKEAQTGDDNLKKEAQAGDAEEKNRSGDHQAAQASGEGGAQSEELQEAKQNAGGGVNQDTGKETTESDHEKFVQEGI